MNTAQPPDWNHIRAFLATAETGSLSAAARQLGQTQPTLSRQVAALEADLGVYLFERVGRGLVLTEAGRDLLDHSRQMGSAAEAFALAASGQSTAIEGTIRITASDVLSQFFLPPVLRRLQQMAPRLIIDVVAANDIRDLMRREADIAIRHSRPEQQELIARLAYEGTAHFYAATAYLDQRGRPQSAEEVATHDFVGLGDQATLISFAQSLGLPLEPSQFRISSHNGLVAWELVKQGFGIAPMDIRVAAQTPGVERVFEWIEPVRYPFWLTTHRELHTSRKIRLVFDLLAEALATG
ncbi:LysR family transcriptional regulator [Arenibacterium sp. LLYu02]|uniref:LysR family transcriptional regulator n=1 Tax=Arenibacterium sp. LLYu02 TaxID=3404132 RepID=UPI003B2229F3